MTSEGAFLVYISFACVFFLVAFIESAFDATKAPITVRVAEALLIAFIWPAFVVFVCFWALR